MGMGFVVGLLLGCLAACFQNCKKTEKDTPQEDPVYFTTPVDLELLAFLPDSFLCTATKKCLGWAPFLGLQIALP